MEEFVSRHARLVIGTLCGFDRLLFRGTLRLLAHRGGMMSYLGSVKVLLKNFAAHALTLSEQLKEASLAMARASGRPIRYLASSAVSKEAVAREIARADGIKQGLICVVSAVEPCLTYEIVRKREAGLIDLEPRRRKCLHLYHYQIHPQLGFMHARIQTWFPFSIQVCLNGREWLAHMMDQAGLGYLRRDNGFVWLQDPVTAQRLMDQQLQAAWPTLLDEEARRLNPAHDAMFAAHPIGSYYWTTYQSEWASDILFRDSASLGALYPRLVQHGLLTFRSPDVMRFLGRNVPLSGRLPPALKADVVSDMKARPEGVRLKHWLGANAIKMYDKAGSVLRIETTINDAAGFKSFRTPEGKPDAPKAWHGMRKGIADLHRRAEVSQAANNRYLQALATLDHSRSLGELAARLCRPVICNARRARALNPYGGDADLLAAINSGAFALNGFRNRDLRQLLFADDAAPSDTQRRHAAAITRKLALLRAHGLIRKLHGTHRYQLTLVGRAAITALLAAAHAGADRITKLAA